MGERDEPKSVGIWVRVSTEDQVRGESPEHHEKRARAYAEARSWRVNCVYRLEAVSGKAVMGHPEAQRMIGDIQTGVISGLVFSKLARLARNTKELLEFADIFRAHGADLISLQEAIDTSSPAGRLFFTMIAAMAQWEREEIVDRVKASVPIRAKLGKPIGGAAPFGYRWKDKRLEPDPEEAPVRVLLHELFAEHKRKKTVARILNERGYRTRKGALFSDTTITNLLNDPTAKGLHRGNYTCTDDRKKTWKLKPESEWVYTPVEAIVSEELWDACAGIVAAQLSVRRPQTKRATYLFAGFTYCVCGTKMYVRSGSPKYVCESCRNKIPMTDLEAVYREQLRNFLVSPEEIDAHNAAARDALKDKERLADNIQTELKKIETAEDRLFQLYEAAELSKEDFGRRHRPLSERRSQLEDELPRIQAECDVMRITSFARQEALSEARDLTERWGELPDEDKRQIVEAITERIVIDKEDIEITLLQLAEPAKHVANRQRGHMAALPFCELGVRAVLRACKPKPERENGDSLASMLRRRRSELGQTQTQAAEVLGISPWTLLTWEGGKASPEAQWYPAIISFLGYEPWPAPTTLGDQLKEARLRRGWTIRAAAKALKVDEETFSRWQNGQWTPQRKSKRSIERLIRPNSDTPK